MRKINLKDVKGLVTQVYYLENYDTVNEFARNQRNRMVNKQHVNDFYQKICENGVNEDGSCYGPYPLHINKRTNHILDGQHRREAYLKAIENGIIPEDTLIHVAYEDIPEEKELARIIDLNVNSKNWTLDDYVQCEKDYNDNFKRLTDFAYSHELCYTEKNNGERKPKYRYAAAILTGKGCCSELKNRTIKISKEDMENGDKIHNDLVAIKKELCKQKRVEYTSNTYNDTEAMAIQWSKMSQFITPEDFKVRIPVGLLNKDTRKQADWKNLFSYIYTEKMKKKSA